MKGKNVSQEISITIKIIRNKIFDRLESLNIKYNELKVKYEELKEYNLIDKEENIVKEVEKTLKEIQALIIQNELTKIEERVIYLENNLKELEEKMKEKEIKLFLSKYWPHLLIGTLSAIVLSYFLSQILIPLIAMEKEMNKLRKEEQALIKARIELEKQYFTRKISEELFKKMIMERQQQILGIRGKIKLVMQEREKIFRERLNPMAFVKWLISIKDLPFKIYQKIRKTNVKELVKKEIESIKKILEKLKTKQIIIYGKGK